MAELADQYLEAQSQSNMGRLPNEQCNTKDMGMEHQADNKAFPVLRRLLYQFWEETGTMKTGLALTQKRLLRKTVRVNEPP